jgi:hypothetical protein
VSPAARSAPSPQAGYSQRPLLDKLGVKPGTRVALVGLDDAPFRALLRTRVADVAIDRPRKNTDLILFAIDGPGPLRRLTALEKSIQPAGAIWVLWPKGQKHITEDMIRGAAIAQGLVDIKVIAFSHVLSGLKLVIPLALRGKKPKR